MTNKESNVVPEVYGKRESGLVIAVGKFVEARCPEDGQVTYRRIGRLSLLSPRNIRLEWWKDTTDGVIVNQYLIGFDRSQANWDIEASHVSLPGEDDQPAKPPHEFYLNVEDQSVAIQVNAVQLRLKAITENTLADLELQLPLHYELVTET